MIERKTTNRLVGLSLILPVILLTGCLGDAIEQAIQSAGKAAAANQLKALGLAYHNHCDVHKMGPENWDAFIGFAESNEWSIEYADGRRSVLDAAVVKQARDAGVVERLMVEESKEIVGFYDAFFQLHNVNGFHRILLYGAEGHAASEADDERALGVRVEQHREVAE